MRALAFLLTWLMVAAVSAAQPAVAPAPPPDGVAALVERVQTLVSTNDASALRDLLAPGGTSETTDVFVAFLAPGGVTHAVVRERDRVALNGQPPGAAYRLVVEAFIERGFQAAIFTFRLDVVRAGREADDAPWVVRAHEMLTSVEGLFHLELNRQKQFNVHNLEVRSEDFVLSFPSGSAFVAETPGGITALVLLGAGEMRFTPQPEAERGQVRLFCGHETLVTPVSAAMVRLNPGSFEETAAGGLVAREVDARDLQRAVAVFDEEIGKSFSLDLKELSGQSWSLVPGFGDFLAEVRTRKYNTLTYARSMGEAEDVTLFDRKRRRNIAVYPSRRIRETRGVSFNEDELADYDILDYDIDASFDPQRQWLEGRARVKVRVQSYVLSTLTLKLNEALAVRSVTSEEQGRLLSIRVKGQNNVILNLPKLVNRDDVLVLHVRYGGRLEPEQPDREVADVQSDRQVASDAPTITPEPRYVFSNRSYWYPQNGATDFATAHLRLTVPAPFRSLGSGSPVGTNPQIERSTRQGEPDRVVSEFIAGQPLRYLSWAVTPLVLVSERSVQVEGGTTETSSAGETDFSPGAGVRYQGLDLSVVANPRQVNRGRTLIDDVQRILGFFANVVGDLPYPTFTLALVDSETPGGHSPAYFALLYQPLPGTPYIWRNDPVYFDNFPQFFIAHELAHQFWGQAIGWKSYHEQWVSEAFAQYFAALWAERRSVDTFDGVLRRMRHTALDNETQGPISLGYRLGHIQGNSRVFRAVLYNKGALVIHMLRRLLGDEVFFEALRTLYQSSRFTKIGTDEVKAAFEAVSGRTLDRFFQGWVYESRIPLVRWSWRLDDSNREGPDAGRRLVLSFAQDATAAASAFVVPVTVTLGYVDGTEENVVVSMTEPTLERRLPVRGDLRSVQVNLDGASLARFERR